MAHPGWARWSHLRHTWYVQVAHVVQVTRTVQVALACNLVLPFCVTPGVKESLEQSFCAYQPSLVVCPFGWAPLCCTPFPCDGPSGLFLSMVLLIRNSFAYLLQQNVNLSTIR